MVKNPPARQKTQEMRVGFLDQEDPLELEVATHSSILAWEIPWTEELEGYSPWGYEESDMAERVCARALLPHYPLQTDFDLQYIKKST